MCETTYKLDELAKAAGTSARTVRYYVQRGLLPAPVFRGKDTAYAEEHLVRLRAIRQLQEAYLPLDAIAAELEGKSIDAIERIASSAPTPAPASRPAAVPPTVRFEERAWERITISPGLEIHLAADASREEQELFSRVLRVVQGSDKE